MLFCVYAFLITLFSFARHWFLFFARKKQQTDIFLDGTDKHLFWHSASLNCRLEVYRFRLRSKLSFLQIVSCSSEEGAKFQRSHRRRTKQNVETRSLILSRLIFSVATFFCIRLLRNGIINTIDLVRYCKQVALVCSLVLVRLVRTRLKYCEWRVYRTTYAY